MGPPHWLKPLFGAIINRSVVELSSPEKPNHSLEGFAVPPLLLASLATLRTFLLSPTGLAQNSAKLKPKFERK